MSADHRIAGSQDRRIIPSSVKQSEWENVEDPLTLDAKEEEEEVKEEEEEEEEEEEMMEVMKVMEVEVVGDVVAFSRL